MRIYVVMCVWTKVKTEDTRALPGRQTDMISGRAQPYMYLMYAPGGDRS